MYDGRLLEFEDILFKSYFEAIFSFVPKITSTKK